jgi:hypothetical protein
MLKYLFQANFKDGSFIQQTQADESATTPGKNCFHDVKQRIDDVVSFGFFSDETPNTYVVDLTDGHFEVNGTPFTAQDPSGEKLPSDAKFRLVYFKRHCHGFNVDLQEVSHDLAFHLGWQVTTPDGKNIQQTIAIQ